ncbi:hypothetical protein [Metabacillus iocasae]|uniref:Frataxin-like iron-binding protein CyaY n=1 Tax=Priestia iocasae TaxID=2291674 RepID=A0ABS2QW01_9BACI|nr:hypothetical protein [Metabacillus iocasae]MBM7703122.1 frataxin-like iron-binding protein CyaY [Metabacillus iocasae]
MLTVDSYLKRPSSFIEDSIEAASNPYQYFIHLHDQRVKRMLNQFDHQLLEGAIVLKYGDETLIGFQQYNLVDELWTYILNLIAHFQHDKQVETYFRDQSLLIGLEQISEKKIRFQLNNQSWTLPKKDLIQVLLTECEHFFSTMGDYYQTTKYTNQLEKLQSMKLS